MANYFQLLGRLGRTKAYFGGFWGPLGPAGGVGYRGGSNAPKNSVAGIRLSNSGEGSWSRTRTIEGFMHVAQQCIQGPPRVTTSYFWAVTANDNTK